MKTFYEDDICYIVNCKSKESILYSRLFGLEKFQIVLHHTDDKALLDYIAAEMKETMRNVFIDMRCLYHCYNNNLTTVPPEMIEEFSIEYSDIPQYAHLFNELMHKYKDHNHVRTI
jgi:hypothetical protein